MDVMSAMQSLEMFENGEYMVIYVDMMTYSTKEALVYLTSKFYPLGIISSSLRYTHSLMLVCYIR